MIHRGISHKRRTRRALLTKQAVTPSWAVCRYLILISAAFEGNREAIEIDTKVSLSWQATADNLIQLRRQIVNST